MEHLSPETLARLADAAPSADEGRHLEECGACAAELRAYREQGEALARLPDLRPPGGDWEVLQARLVSEGLMEGGGRLRSMARTTGWMKAAAAAVVFLVGAGVGAAAAPGPFPIGGVAGPGVGPLSLVSSTPRTVDDAAEAVRLAERQYMDAWILYRQALEAEGGDGLPDPATRIAALEYIVQAGRTALNEAPADPFLNGLVVSALAERDAVIRRASSTSGESWY